jgi:hypothetical protein
MFQELDREFSTVRLILQLVVVYLLPLFAVGFIETLFGITDSPIWQTAVYFLVAAIGLCAGLVLCRLAPGSAREGVRVWLFPATLFVLGILYDLASGHGGDFLGYFYAGPGDRNELPALCTVPTWGCCCYATRPRSFGAANEASAIKGVCG